MSRIYDALKDAEHRRTTEPESTATVLPPAGPTAPPPERSGLMGALKTRLFSSVRPSDEGVKLNLRPEGSEEKAKGRPAKVIEPARERPAMDPAAPADAPVSLPAALAEVPRGDERADDIAGNREGIGAPEAGGLSQQLVSASGKIASVEAGFTRLAERLLETARNLQQSGGAPSEDLIAELSNCRRDFQATGAGVVKLARSLGAPAQFTAEPPGSIGDLRALLEVASFHDSRRQAIAVLDRVLSISHRDSAEFQPLLECQAGARQLREAIVASEWPAHHPDSQSLSSAEHPFAKLAVLTERGEKLSDEQWLSFHDEVARSFGKPLALAITRNRLLMNGASSSGRAPISQSPLGEPAPQSAASPAETSGRCWSCDAELESEAKFCGECGAPAA